MLIQLLFYLTSREPMACKYMVFLPIFLVFIIHSIVFSSHYRIATQYLRSIWAKLMKSLRFRKDSVLSHSGSILRQEQVPKKQQTTNVHEAASQQVL